MMTDIPSLTTTPVRLQSINIAWREAEVIFGFSREKYLTLEITRRYLVPADPVSKIILHDGKTGPVAMLTKENESGFEILGTIRVPDEIFYSVRTSTAEITELAGNMTRTYEVPVGAPANSPFIKVSIH